MSSTCVAKLAGSPCKASINRRLALALEKAGGESAMVSDPRVQVFNGHSIHRLHTLLAQLVK